jgi:hypothetical protein
VLICVISLTQSLRATVLEFSGAVAVDVPSYKTLPGLSAGVGWGFSVGILPFQKAGLSLGANSTSHKMDSDPSRGHDVRGDSRRTSVFIQGQYCFLQKNDVDFIAYLAATYNSIDGGDKNGSYTDIGIDPQELGYSGWGTMFGAGVSHKFAENYSLCFGARYNLLNYSKHQYPHIPTFEQPGPNHRRGNSLIINLGIIYSLDFAGF